jgi:hypothetical protein
MAELDAHEGFHHFSDDDDEDEEREKQDEETKGDEGEGDEMDVDVTRMPWDAPGFRGLLNIDEDIMDGKEHRPASYRIPWMNSD